MQLSRRALLGTVGSLGVGALAGCSGTGGEPSSTPTREGTPVDGGPPTADGSLYLGHETQTVLDNVVSGGVPKDGIPSIDDPSFLSAEEATLDDGHPVFGVVRDGEAKAYPQRILAQHEIVNDTVGGDPVSVTYCPLTGTAQGFDRGDTEFGVSGRLVNSNLTMYDRATDSWWPQMLATAIDGPLRGEALREFRVVWTSWGEWRAANPDTALLSEDTGYSRRYGDDPYGSYNPPSGYYDSDRTLFDPLTSDDRAGAKRVVIGTRTEAGALTFDKEALLSQTVLRGTIAGTEYVAVADDALSTGYVYANPEETSVEAVGDGYSVGGETYDADALPLERSLAFDGMWFAWAGFYPEVPYVR